MRRRLNRAMLRLCALTAAALCALLLVESVRSFYRSDTASVGIVTFVTHRGSLYIVSNNDPTLDVESEPVTGAPAWPIRYGAFPLRTWNDQTVLGFNGWTGTGVGSASPFILIQAPMWFALVLAALLAVCCYRRYAEIIPRTHYLECPSCGHLLVGVVHWRCPECGHRTVSRVVEAMPSRRTPANPSAHLQIHDVRARHVTRDHFAGQV